MAESIEAMRQALARLVARTASQYPYSLVQIPATVAEAHGVQQAASKIVVQPVDGVEWNPLQVMDTGDTNFGKFYFVPDVDFPGDPTKVIR